MDISNQSSKLNNGLVEKKEDIINKQINDYKNLADQDYEVAIKVFDDVMDLFIANDLNLRTAYAICYALADSLLQYMAFGEVEQQ